MLNNITLYKHLLVSQNVKYPQNGLVNGILIDFWLSSSKIASNCFLKARPKCFDGSFWILMNGGIKVFNPILPGLLNTLQTQEGGGGRILPPS